MKKSILLKAVVITLLALPSFWLMLRFGVYTMHDFHIFRQFEMDKCIQEGIFPCRWAPDAGKGYGEPLFNFYGQLPYWIGEIFHLSGLSIIDSVKLLFILSIVLSGFSMYFVSSKYWGKWGGLLSSVVYMYAPYRALDVWVRGALNESIAFVLFPVIFYNLDSYIDSKKGKYLLFLILGLSALVTTHNLSFLMMIPFFGLWWVYKSFRAKNISSLPGLLLAGGAAFILSSYYLIPVLFESALVTVSKTTEGYYNYRAHFATLNQLFVSRFWGFGASLWGPVDDMSFSLGQSHWILLALSGVLYVVRKKFSETFIILASLSALGIFLTHGRSQFIWNLITPLEFVQFPWRFLGLAGFFLALAVGYLSRVTSKWFILVSVVFVILTNYTFFRFDIWRPIGDSEQFSGLLWDEQRSSALQDFWPKSAPEMPIDFAPVLENSWIKAHSAEFDLEAGDHELPIVYFPGWRGYVDGKEIAIEAKGKLGLISLSLGEPAKVRLNFTNTWPRTLGNTLSIIGVAVLAIWAYKVYSRS